MTPTPTDPGPTPTLELNFALNHFMCYELKRKPNPPTIEDFPLEDQFGPSLVEARRRWRICNPTSKNGENPNAALSEDHYVAYLIKQTDPRSERFDDITVVNQFGIVSVDLKKPKAMMVPSAKEFAIGGVPPIPPANPAIDHMKCWDVRGARTRVNVTSDDQFGHLLVDVKKPVRLCAPANADGSPVNDPETHMMCYKVKTDPRNLLSGVELFIANQFEEERVTLTGPREICVPSLKVRCCGPNDRCIDLDGTASPDRGLAVDVPLGAALLPWPAADPDDHMLSLYDNNGNDQWNFGSTGDDLTVEGTPCGTAVPNGLHDLGDCVLLDANSSLSAGQSIDCDLDSGAGCSNGLLATLKFYDTNGDNAWDDGEDIIFDANGNGICD